MFIEDHHDVKVYKLNGNTKVSGNQHFAMEWFNNNVTITNKESDSHVTFNIFYYTNKKGKLKIIIMILKIIWWYCTNLQFL